MLITGVVLAARVVRDWSAQRTTQAVAREAEAEAEMTEARTGLYKWLVREAKRGQTPTAWQTALGAVQGIYLIADTSTGQLYVGKADGGERILGRWTAYARDGHGGNIAMRDLAGRDPTHPRHFVFSILRVFGPSVPTAEVDEAESHFKRALLTRQHGLNRN